MKECMLNGVVLKGNCCCNCKYHLQDFHHCTTVNSREHCVCSEPKGWICAGEAIENGHYHSGWSEHGLCELWDNK